MASWTYGDYADHNPGTTARLSQFRLHLKEVRDAIKTGNYSEGQKSHDINPLQRYLEFLMKQEPEEVRQAKAANYPRFTSGRALNP